MKRFLAIYIGSGGARGNARWSALDEQQRKAIQERGIKEWMHWGTVNGKAIVDHGSPLGKTKRASREGIADFENAITAYVIVEAESHAAAAKLFENHPHFSVFPGDSVEIMECLPPPGH
jgi:hypothetical protein